MFAARTPYTNPEDSDAAYDVMFIERGISCKSVLRSSPAMRVALPPRDKMIHIARLLASLIYVSANRILIRTTCYQLIR